MAGVIAVSPKFYFPGAEGGEVDVYIAGTTTRTDTWQDRAQSTANENPVELNARAECVLWLDSALRYKFVVKNALGVTLYTVDNVAGAEPGTSSIAEFTVDRFSGDGADTTFTLSVTPDSENATDVFVAGVYQQKNTYSVAGTTLTFAVAPASGTNNIEVVTKNILDYTDVAADVAISVAAAAASETAAAASASSAAASATAADASADAAALSESQAAEIVLGNFQADAASAVPRTFSDKGRDIVSIFEWLTTAQKADVRAFTYGQDLTTPINTGLSEGAGKTIFFPEGGYLTGRMLPNDDTTLWVDGGSTVRKKSGGTQVMKVAAKSNVHVVGNGCVFDGQTHQDATSGDTVNFSDSHDCSMTNVHVLGAGTNTQDCLYIGSDGDDEPCTNIKITGGSLTAAKRNGLSIVAGKRIVIDGVEISGTTGAPGAAIDIEANVHGMIEDVEIKHCDIHDNVKWGVVVVFGHDVHIHHNRIYDNGDAGIGASAGGTQFDLISDGDDNDVARSDIDLRAISAVDTGTGELTVSGFDTFEVGTICTPRVRDGAVLPTGLTAGSLYLVHSKASGKVILSSTAFGGITSFAGAGSGTLTTDPTTSDWYLHCFEKGQCSKLNIHDNHLWGNNQVRGQIDILQAVDVRVWENEVEGELDQTCVSFIYCRDIYIARNEVIGNVASTSASARGIHVGISSRVQTDTNDVSYCAGPGMNFGGVMLPRIWKGDVVTNCGMVGTRMYAIENVKKAKVEGVRLRSDPAYPATNGMSTTTVEYSVFRDVIAEGVGSTNATSLAISGTGNRIEECIQKDGTYWGSGSVSFNPASLADGARETATSITVAGAALGDHVRASFSLSLQNVKLWAYVSATDTVIPVFENESGGIVDLGSGTIRVQVSKGL